MQPDDENRWKIKREISLGDLVAIAVAIAGVVLAYGTLDKRVSVLEAGAANAAIALSDIRDTIREIDRKLTALLLRDTKAGH
jgi:hypothetical protein